MLLTIPQMFLAAYDRGHHRTAFHWKEDGEWKSMTWHKAVEEVSAVTQALRDDGVKAGTPVGILSDTCKEWGAIDQGTHMLRGVVVGIYPSLLAEQVHYILEHAEVEVLVIENAAQAEKIAQIRDRLPKLRSVVTIKPVEGLPSLEDYRRAPDIGLLRELAPKVEPDDVATIIYTSGTTGNPKGAVLTHRNFAHICHVADVPETRPGERGLIWLPMAHSLQRMAGYRSLLLDGEGWYVDGIDQLPEAIEVCRPTLLASVPRMLEKIHARAESKVNERGPRVRRIYEWAFRQGRRRTELQMANKPLPLWLRMKLRVADRLVFRKIRDRLGGDCRAMVSGGAALNPEVAHWFFAMGIAVLEGWGLTETAAPVTCNRERDFRIGTVGKPLAGVEVRIAEDGEVLVKSPGVFQGYFKNPEATEEAFVDGWFRTGDIGVIDADGFLTITDRKKEIIITAGGKNIPPVNIEKLVERSPYVAQCVAIGEGRPYLVALVVPDDEALDTLDLPDEPLAERVKRPEVQQLFADAVAGANAELARFETLKKFEVLPVTFSVETGELTPTLKLKRRVVNAKFGDSIERLYAPEAS